MDTQERKAVVVQTIEGGCGGITRTDHLIPDATGARTTMMGELDVLAGDEVVAVFQPGTWVSWRLAGPDAVPSPRTGPEKIATSC